jgi:hypothetical protein
MLAAILALTAIVAAAPLRARAPAVSFTMPDLAGRVIQVGCRQGECVWLRMVRLEAAAANPHGELRRLIGRGGSSLYRNGIPPRAYGRGVRVRWDARDHREYVFCSTERPAHAFPDDGGGLILHYLDLFALAGYQMSSATMYMRACHGRSFDWEDRAALRRLGYRPGTRRDQVEDAAPGDLARF